MLGILLTLSIARATSYEKVVTSRLALLQLSHRLGHLAPIAMSDPDRGFTYGVLHDSDYRGEVFRTIECCGPIATAPRGEDGPLLAAFAKDGHGSYAGEIRAKLLAELASAASARNVSPAAQVAELERYLMRPSLATKFAFTAAYARTQEDLVEALGRTESPAALRGIKMYLEGLKDAYGDAVERAPGFGTAVGALRRIYPRHAHTIVRTTTGVIVQTVTPAPPPRSCECPLVISEPQRRSWWARLFRRGGPL